MLAPVRLLAVALSRACTAALGLALAAGAAFAAQETRTGPDSGRPVPRFESLKFDQVYGREGPSTDHPIVWEYRRRGLPMLVIEEDVGWRRVRDPDGDEVWINAGGLDSRRMAVVTGEPADILREPSDDASVAAMAAPGVLLEVKDCRDGWLRVDAPRAAGWLPEAAVWGPGCEG